ncbi:NAD(P)-dependent oxidoreductase [Massilia violaceinigra]|uniref:NAD(P)-dependent oxidoreductase n=1 Tax=Massilia violaceinigra TaxID=2045208 RepID=A0ABY4A841_9BURK|nr:NAD(P)-dependent oxidoreductase [Massilia violaceinigra]UOD30315.1 NAD(P)-dependent oxidoreductase [Massilia violaceinigra]
MNIVLIGATGFIGTALLNEALNRGHAVTALATRPEKLAARERLQAHKTDVMDVSALTVQLAGADAVLSAFSGHAQGDVQAYYLAGVRNIIAAVKEARAPRLLVVGGAGSLAVAPGVQLLDTPGFPEAYRASAEGARQALNLLRAEASLDWTMLSPAAMISPGQRSGVFRLGGDQLLADAAGNSAISVEDYAVAMIDELEQPAHSRQRFTLAY